MRQRGFTLVELLVVVSIIAILSVIGIAIFTNTQVDARDAKRKGDLDALAQALEASYGKDTTNPQTYKLDSANFNNNKIPVDGGTLGYCFTYNTSRNLSAADVTTFRTPPAAWTAGNSCTNPTTSPVSVTSILASNSSQANIVLWRVCAVLEKTSQVVCKFSAQ